MTEVIQEAATPRAAPRRRRRALGAGILVVAVVACGSGWKWLHSPDPLADYPVGEETAPGAAGHTVYSDTGIVPAADSAGGGPASTWVTIDSITPVVVENTSHALIGLDVCTRNGSHTGIGMQDGDLSASCSSMNLFQAPQRLDLGFMTAQVIVTVTPGRAGTVHIAGFDVTYRQGLQHSSQHVGTDITLTTKAPG